MFRAGLYRVRCHRLWCHKPADVLVGRHHWCAAHGTDHLIALKRQEVNARG